MVGGELGLLRAQLHGALGGGADGLDQFKLEVKETTPDQQAKNPFDKYDHRLVLVLVDHKRRIRGTYDFSQPDMNDVYGEKLRKDLKEVLKEAKEPPTPGS